MMNDNQLDAAIKNLLYETLKVQPDLVNDQTRRGELEQWDSLGHLTLIEALRQHFDIEIPAEMALEIETVRDIKKILVAASVRDKDWGASQ